MYSAFPGNCSVSYLSFVYGRSLWAELNGGENSLHWKANMLPLFSIMTLCLVTKASGLLFCLYTYLEGIWVHIQEPLDLVGVVVSDGDFQLQSFARNVAQGRGEATATGERTVVRQEKGINDF